MDISFYTAGTGAKAQQTKLDVVANNLANVNTAGYKAQREKFADLLYSNIREPQTTDTQLRVGSGARIETTDIDQRSGGYNASDNPIDYAINGSGFFAVQNPVTEEILYTRDGSFQQSLLKDGKFYLVTSKGDFVLDKSFQRVEITPKGADEPEFVSGRPAVFDFSTKDGMLRKGDNLFSPAEKNGPPIYKPEAKIVNGYLESSNVDTGNEFLRMIEAQRAYSMSLKMIQTSNEIEQTIESLRG
ncbi:MAG: flagellar hook-basal body protein [Eubacteriales bacterium]